MIDIEMKMFGVFRKFQKDKKPITFKIKSPASIEQVKKVLSVRLSENSKEFDGNAEQLIMDSAIADDNEVLTSNTILDHSCSLSILPPVCGG